MFGQFRPSGFSHRLRDEISLIYLVPERYRAVVVDDWFRSILGHLIIEKRGRRRFGPGAKLCLFALPVAPLVANQRP
jgi:hypothetical protein